MRKECRQTHENNGLMQTLKKGGWKRRAKKVIASVMAAALVVTSGAVVPQNTTVAEAADQTVIDTIGTDNGNGGYTLGFAAFADYHRVPIAAGDFSLTFTFHQASNATANHEAYAVIAQKMTDATSEWYQRADIWAVADPGNTAFGGQAVTYDGHPVWDSYWATMKDAEITITLTRTGTDMVMNHSVEGANGVSYSFNSSVSNCPTEALYVWLGGEGSKLSLYSVTGTTTAGTIAKHKVTVNCYEQNTTTSVRDAIVEEFYLSDTYTVNIPNETVGYTPLTTSVTGTMGETDVTETVYFESAPSHTVTVNYVAEDGSTLATTTQSANVDESKTYKIASPTVDGYCPDKLAVTGTMGTSNVTETVTYKKIIDTIGTANADGSYTLVYDATDDYHYVPVGEGDFNVTFKFHNASVGNVAWDNYAVAVKNKDASSIWYERADRYAVPDWTAFGGKTVDYSIDLPGDYLATIKDAEVTVAVRREGTNMSMTHTVTGANGTTYTQVSSVADCPTEALDVWLGGQFCQVSLYEVSGTSSLGTIEKHKVTVNYVKTEDDSEIADTVVEEYYPGESYTITSPTVLGYEPDITTVEGTMEETDVTKTVKYTSVDVHTLTINYVYEDDTTAAESYVENVNKGATYKVVSPTVTGYLPDKKVVEGTMGDADDTITVTYSKDPAIARIGTDNGNGTYTLKWGDYPNFYGIDVPEGDFSLELEFHNNSAGTVNWDGYGISLVETANAGAASADDVDNMYVRADAWCDKTFASTGTAWVKNDSGTNWDIFNNIKNDSDVNLLVTRMGSTITVTAKGTSATEGSFEWIVTAENCPTGALKAFLGGTNCYVVLNKVTFHEKHKLTVNYVYADGTKAADSKTVDVFANSDYSIESPSLKGYTADKKVVEGTMGDKDDTITVTYSEATAYTLTIKYQRVSGKEMADSVVVKIDEGKEYSYVSPVVSGYHPDKSTVSGVMPSEDTEIVVTYKWVDRTLGVDNGDGTFTLAFLDYDNYHAVTKGDGDFKVSFNFHNDSAGVDNWLNYAVFLKSSAGSTWNLRGDMYSYVSDWSNTAFGQPIVYSAAPANWDDFRAMVKDSEVAVTVERSGSTITISNDITGANGETFSWTATTENCPTDDMTIYLGGDTCEVSLYEATKSDVVIVDTYGITVNYVYEDGTTAAPSKSAGPYVVGTPYHIPSPTIEGYVPDKAAVAGNTPNYYTSVTVTYKKKSTEAIATLGSIDADGNPYLAYNDLDSYYNVPVSSGDFAVDFEFNQKAKASNNWEAYAIIVKTADGSEWYHRADLWSNSDVGNTAFGGKAVTYDGAPVWGDNFATYQETMKDADITIKVTRVGTKMVITHSVFGANGVNYSYTSTVEGCPTEDVSVYLGGEMCKLTVYKAAVNGEPGVAPTEKPSAEPTTAPTEEPSAEPTVAPTEEPTVEPSTEPTAAPTEAPVEEGDKVKDSNGTFKVTDTEKKTVTYTLAKKSNKKTVTVPNTVTVDGVKYKVTAIAKNAFKNNKKVEKIVVNKNITKIDANAFKNCKKLTTIVVKSTKIKSVAKNALKGTNKKLVIKVPAKKVAAYKKLFAGKGNNNVVVKKA